MFRAARCSSSGGPIVSPRPLVSSTSVSSRTVYGWMMKICPLAVEFFHAVRQRDGQTAKANLIVAFRNTAKAPKNNMRKATTICTSNYT